MQLGTFVLSSPVLINMGRRGGRNLRGDGRVGPKSFLFGCERLGNVIPWHEISSALFSY